MRREKKSLFNHVSFEYSHNPILKAIDRRNVKKWLKYKIFVTVRKILDSVINILYTITIFVNRSLIFIWLSHFDGYFQYIIAKYHAKRPALSSNNELGILLAFAVGCGQRTTFRKQKKWGRSMFSGYLKKQVLEQFSVKWGVSLLFIFLVTFLNISKMQFLH